MGIRFRKSFKLAPGIRMNLSGGGTSFSFGPRGASVSVGKRGVYGNVGIPGTSLSSRQKLSGNQPSRNASSQQSQYISLPVSVGVNDNGELFFVDESGQPLAEHLVATAKKQHGERIKQLIQSKCDEINAQIEAVGDLHVDTPSPETKPVFVPCMFPHPCPAAPVLKVPGFFAKFLESKRLKIDKENQQAERLHRTHVSEWEKAVAQHKQTENERRNYIEELIYTDVESMESYLETVLQDIAWPRETLVTAELVDFGQVILIDVDLPEVEDMPSKTAGVPSRGMKLSVKEMSPTQLQRLYMRHIHSIGFRIVGEAFAALPKTDCVVLSGCSQRRNKSTGHISDEYLYSVKVRREAWRTIDFSPDGLRSLDVMESLARFDLKRTMSKTGIFKPITPFAIGE